MRERYILISGHMKRRKIDADSQVTSIIAFCVTVCYDILVEITRFLELAFQKYPRLQECESAHFHVITRVRWSPYS